MKFFDWLNRGFADNSKEPAVFTHQGVAEQSAPAKNPNAALYATAILMLSEIADTQRGIEERAGQIQLARRAKALGFTGSYEVTEQTQFDKKVELLEFMIGVWRDLGHNAILIRHEQFRAILRKHDLMCVPFSHYKGDIPEKTWPRLRKHLGS